MRVRNRRLLDVNVSLNFRQGLLPICTSGNAQVLTSSSKTVHVSRKPYWANVPQWWVERLKLGNYSWLPRWVNKSPGGRLDKVNGNVLTPANDLVPVRFLFSVQLALLHRETFLARFACQLSIDSSKLDVAFYIHFSRCFLQQAWSKRLYT